MGLILNVYRAAGPDCTNGGATANCDRICVVNVSGPVVPGPNDQAFELVGQGSTMRLVPLDYQPPAGTVGPMFGGNYAATSDSRFRDAIGGFIGALPIFDRYESAEDYAANFD